MEGARRVGVPAASLHCSGIRWPQPSQTREGAEWLRDFVLQGCQRTRCIHHSAELHGFYTNRLYKKRCARCGRPNIVAVTRCGYCDETLTDENIHPVGRDVLKELAASRTHNHSRINLFLDCADARIATPSHTPKFHGRFHLPLSCDASASVRGNLHFSPFNESWQPHSFKEDSKTRNIVRLPPSFSKNQPPSIIEYYRSFDFLIMQYPFPIAAVHLSAVVKGTVYDVKQLRPTHVPLLQRMQRQTAAVVEDILQAEVHVQKDKVLLGARVNSTDVIDERTRGESCARGGSHRFLLRSQDRVAFDKDITTSVAGSANGNGGLSQLWRRAGDAHEESASFTSQKQRAAVMKIVEKLKSCVIFGFTYPCEYSQVNMHAIVPPIFNFNMMKAPFFLPLKKVLQDLQQSGYVQVNERDAENTALGRDAVLEEAQLVDASIRRLLWSQARVS